MANAPLPASKLPELRRLLRARRRALSPSQQKAAARRLLRAVTTSPEFLRARRIAIYITADGEIDPALIAVAARRLGKQVFLPVLGGRKHSDQFMSFRLYRASERLRMNRFGIPEPRTLRGVRPWQLDLVLVPLVAFDDAGNRLGMGGGFYDRTFAKEASALWPRRPRLCGLAHRLQRVDALPAKPWDVPLTRVFTG